jgi:hypothetical protein
MINSNNFLSHRADEKVNGEGLTRLEAAEQERRKLVIQETERHARALVLECELHNRELDNITRTFGLRMGVA